MFFGDGNLMKFNGIVTSLVFLIGYEGSGTEQDADSMVGSLPSTTLIPVQLSQRNLQDYISSPTLNPDTCSGNRIGLYAWGYEVWNSTSSPMIDFLSNPSVRDYSCGDIYINVADYTASTYIRDELALVPFIKSVRSTGNTGVVFLVYGDVQVSGHEAEDGPTEFADTFFRWVSSISDSDLHQIAPVGVSYDCEHLSVKVIETALNRAQDLKREVVISRLGGDDSLIQIEWTVEGQEKPDDTDMIMRLADRALIMNYRTHISSSVKDPLGRDNMITRLFDFMFKRQCKRCLDDAYATANYKAKIRIMLEADCQCGASCRKISFCAYDSREPGWGDDFTNGAEYMMHTLYAFDTELRSGRRLSPSQYERLFGSPQNLQLFVVHNWHWFTCFFDDPSVAVSTPIGKKLESCINYHSMAQACRRNY